MQVSSTAGCTAVSRRHQPAARPPRTLTVTRFQSPAQQGSQQPVAGATSSHEPLPAAIPAPQEMQASVMLVPKEKTAQNLLKQADASGSPINSFLVKCRLAWNLFFPAEASGATRQLSPKELGKQRLSMILVADRCGLSPNSLVEMKKSTLAALQDCMDLEDLQDAHLRFSITRTNGTTYSMAVPILRPDPAEGQEEEQGPGASGSMDEYDESATAMASWEEFEEAGFDEAGFEEEEGEQVGSEASQASVEEQQSAMAAAADAVSALGAEGAVQQPVAADAASSYSRPTAAAARRDWRAKMSSTEEPATATAAAGVTATAAARAATASPSTKVRPSSRASSRSASRAAAARGSRGSSPALDSATTTSSSASSVDSSSVITPDMLKELLVEELVHDVESAAGAGPRGAAEVLAEQLEAAVAEVQHFGDAAGAGEAGAGEGSDAQRQ